MSNNFNQQSRIFVAGSQTLIGAGIVSVLQREGYTNLVDLADDALADAIQVENFFAEQKPEYVFFAAGKSGGISANQQFPATLMLDNLKVLCHVMESAHRHQVKKLLYLASACVYPKQSPQPMPVEALLTGPFEPTNDAYATAKLAGIKLCQAYRQEYGANFISGIPANIYGPGDHFDPRDSHVIGALIYRMDQARRHDTPAIDIWGTGKARREFLYVDDLADACIFAMHHYDEREPLNLGGGEDLSIGELAVEIKQLTGYTGELRFDTSKPDGMPLKALDAARLHQMGWQAKTTFRQGLSQTYGWYRTHVCKE